MNRAETTLTNLFYIDPDLLAGVNVKIGFGYLSLINSTFGKGPKTYHEATIVHARSTDLDDCIELTIRFRSTQNTAFVIMRTQKCKKQHRSLYTAKVAKILI